MTEIKAHTDVEQSRKLAEILPPESADMTHYTIVDWIRGKMTIKDWYVTIGLDSAIKNNLFSYREKYIIPCWSLTALLSVLPNYQLQTQDDGIGILCSCNGKFNIMTANNPVDACYEMILNLHELNLL